MRTSLAMIGRTMAGAEINGRLHQALSGRGTRGITSPRVIGQGMIGPLPQAPSGKETLGAGTTTSQSVSCSFTSIEVQMNYFV